MKFLTVCILAHVLVTTSAMTSYELQNVYNLTTLCPLTDFCTTNALHHGNTSCCSECSCEPDCNMRGNCCPDAEVVHRPEVDLRECYLPAHNYFFDYFIGIYGYQAYVRCPTSFTNKLIKAKCERVPQFMDELTLVSDKNDYVYKNRYCAECNGITEYNTWLAQIFCSGDDRHKYTTSWKLDIPKHVRCVIWSHPKNTSLSANYRCFPQAIDECTKNPYDTQNNMDDKALCASYTNYYFHIGNVINIYKNVHCFLCTARVKFKDDDVCPDMSFIQPRFLNNQVYFTGLLNVAFLQQRETAKTKSKHQHNCTSGYAYDPHFNKCRLIKCPWNYISVDTKCVPAYLRSTGVAMAAIFATTSMNEASSIYDSLSFNPLRYYLIQELNIPCDVCNIHIGYFNSSTMAVQISYLTTSTCMVDFLNNRLYGQLKSGDVHIKFRYKKTQYHYTMRMSLDVLKPLSFLNSGRIIHDEDKHCSDVLVYRNELTCPKVILDMDEFEMFQAKHGYSGRFQASYSEFVSTGILSNEIETVVNRNMNGYHLCVDDYITSMTSSHQQMNLLYLLFFIIGIIKLANMACSH